MTDYAPELEPYSADDDNKNPSTPYTEFSYDAKIGETPAGKPKKGIKTGEAFAYTIREKDVYGKPVDRLYMSFDMDKTNSDMLRLQIDPNGIITDWDNLNNDLSKVDEFAPALKSALRAIEDNLKTKRNDTQYELELKKDQKLRSRMRARKTIALVLGGSIVVGGAAWGVETWYLEPGRQADVERAAYDAEGNVLPGESFQLDGMEVSQLPKGEFDAIPEFKKKRDTLESPRTVPITVNTCTVFAGPKPIPGQELSVAIREGSDLDDAKVTASRDSKGIIRLCISESDNESSVAETVAVQLTNEG